MQNHRLLGRGWTLAFTGLALALGTAGCSANMEGGPGEGEETIDSVSEAITFKSNEYQFIETAKTWADAEAACEQLAVPAGSIQRYRLGVPDDLEEEWFFRQEEQNHHDGRWWLGVNDQVSEGFFTTGHSSNPVVGEGKLITYSNFHPGEPNNNGNEDCVMDNFHSDHTWNDSSCSSTAKFVCELNSVDTPVFDPHYYEAIHTDNAQKQTEIKPIPFNVKAGQTIVLGTCGLAGASNVNKTTNQATDTYLRLFNQVGQQVAFNDDACGGRGSNLAIVAATSGTFTVRAGCYGDDACGGTVAISVSP